MAERQFPQLLDRPRKALPLDGPAAPLRGTSLTHEIVLAAHQLPLPHRDPANRFLAATAQVMDLMLVTSDDLLLGLGTIRTMKNWRATVRPA